MSPNTLPPTDNYAALQIVNAWLDIERQKAALDLCTRFATSPVLRPDRGDQFFPDRAGFTDATLFRFLKTSMARELEEQARVLYVCLTDTFRVPASALTHWRNERLGPDREGDQPYLREKPARDISKERAA